MDYDLPALAKKAGLKRTVTLREIQITQTLQKDLYRIANRSLLAWRKQVSVRILPVYASSLAGLTRDDVADDMKEALRLSEALVAAVAVEVSADVADWVQEVLRWHRGAWAARVASGVGVDVFPFVDLRTQDARIKAFLERITSLIRDIDANARKDVAETIWRGLTQQTPRRQMAKELAERLNIGRRRANLIAVDQSQKLAQELNRIRQEEAGITHYRWVHSGKQNYREAHKARNGKTYKMGEPRGDEPGMAIYCGCTGAAVIEAEEE
ncbi:phage head morphogenesis protein [Euryhalocaulis caribicus]|uniref:phage head morphogenesis protein n=1 Tax=Euryhalocaulis caribicus TaxID=1161401 RepID=UPI000399FFCA|nr:phage head morphogenesis protein [Euryhalocaulis caribicus]